MNGWTLGLAAIVAAVVSAVISLLVARAISAGATQSIREETRDRSSASEAGGSTTDREDQYVWGQESVEAVAKFGKVGVQIIIGLGIFALLTAKVILRLGPFPASIPACPMPWPAPHSTWYAALLWKMLSFAACNPTLEIVGKGLAVSAGVELAYMLFTPGPDEAIEPVILGLAAATLLLASGPTMSWLSALAALLLVMSLGGLFWIRKRFISNRRRN